MTTSTPNMGKFYKEEFDQARKERNSLFDSVNKNEKASRTKPQDYVDLVKANTRVYETLYFLR